MAHMEGQRSGNRAGATGKLGPNLPDAGQVFSLFVHNLGRIGAGKDNTKRQRTTSRGKRERP